MKRFITTAGLFVFILLVAAACVSEQRTAKQRPLEGKGPDTTAANPSARAQAPEQVSERTPEQAPEQASERTPGQARDQASDRTPVKMPPQQPADADVEDSDEKRDLDQGPALAVLAEINRARTDPRAYAAYVQSWLPAYEGTDLRLSGNRVFTTTEGAAAAREAVQFLETAQPVRPLTFSEGMSRGARDFVLDQGTSGKTGHAGSRGDQAWDRVNLYGTWEGGVAENISYGLTDPREIVIALLIDDAVPDRGHRKNILNPEFRVFGAALGTHSVYGSMCDMNFASEYREGVSAGERGEED